jgi:hypothetical protein
MLYEFIKGELFLPLKNDFFCFGFVLLNTHNKLQITVLMSIIGPHYLSHFND